MNFTVIIRKSGERTAELCEWLVRQQVANSQIFIVEKSPFVKAVEETFRIGIEQNRQWTIAIDADVLLEDNAIDNILSDLKKLSKKFRDKLFLYQGYVACNLFKKYRAGGIHVYQTKYLYRALSKLSYDENILRPESFVYDKVIATGCVRIVAPQIVGYHAFEQFYFDIFKQGYFRSLKHKEYVGGLIESWINSNSDQTEFKSFMVGFMSGLMNQEKMVVDAEIMKEKLFDSFNETGVVERDDLKASQVEKVMARIRWLVKNYTMEDVTMKVYPTKLSYQSKILLFIGRAMAKYGVLAIKKSKVWANQP
jgi:hypothetical protein